jgi:hypothetical protein
MEKLEMEIKTREVRGDRVSVYLPADVRQRLLALVEQGAYASAVVTACMRESLPTVERAMKRKTAAEKKNQQPTR